MASTSKVSQANAELACSPRRSGENLPAPSCHSDGQLTPSQSIHLETACVGWGWRLNSDQDGSGPCPHGTLMPGKADQSSVTAPRGQGWDEGSTGQGRCLTQ